MLPAADRTTGSTQDGQDEPDHDEDGANGDEDVEAADQEAKNQQDDAEDDHVELLLFVLFKHPTSPQIRKKHILTCANKRLEGREGRGMPRARSER